MTKIDDPAGTSVRFPVERDVQASSTGCSRAAAILSYVRRLLSPLNGQHARGEYDAVHGQGSCVAESLTDCCP